MPISLSIESIECLLFHIPPVFEEWTIVDRYPTLGVSTGIYIYIVAARRMNELPFLYLQKGKKEKQFGFISHHAHLSKLYFPHPLALDQFSTNRGIKAILSTKINRRDQLERQLPDHFSVSKRLR
jgi:hypothetical protein